MKEHPKYKNMKLPFDVWQAITQITAKTGETKGGAVARLVQAERERLEQAEQREKREKRGRGRPAREGDDDA